MPLLYSSCLVRSCSKTSRSHRPFHSLRSASSHGLMCLGSAVVDYRSHREVPCERRLGGRCGGCLPPLRGPLVVRHLGWGDLGLPGLMVTKTSAVPQQQRHRPREAAVPACQQAESTGHYVDLCPVELQTTSYVPVPVYRYWQLSPQTPAIELPKISRFRHATIMQLNSRSSPIIKP